MSSGKKNVPQHQRVGGRGEGKNSATENLNGGRKTAADIAIDLGQGVALSPLLLAGGGAYTAGVAANAAAEDMYNQTAKGRTASEALGSGALTAGAEVAKWKIGKKMPKVSVLNWEPDEKVALKAAIRKIKADRTGFIKNLAKKEKLNLTEETANYLLDFLVDKAVRNPDSEISFQEFARYAAANKTSDRSEKVAEKFYDLVKNAWNTMGS